MRDLSKGRSGAGVVGSALAAMLLVSCGGGSGDSGAGGAGGPDVDIGPRDDDLATSSAGDAAAAGLDGTYRHFGFVDIVSDGFTSEVDIRGGFLEFDEPQPASVFDRIVPLAPDRCAAQVESGVFGSFDVTDVGLPDAPFRFVSAGDVLTLASESGDSYAEVPIEGEGSLQGNGANATYPVPGALTLDIPGEVFPAFADVPVPAVRQASGFEPGRVRDRVTSGTEFTWTPGTALGDGVAFVVEGYAATVDKAVRIRCLAVDDGAFRFPADTVQLLDTGLGGPGVEFDGTDQRALAVTVVDRGEALLIVTRRDE